MQSYCAVAPCICILSHSSLFNLALTLHCATGAYLRHTVVGGTPQPLHNCVSAGSLRSGTPPRGFPSGAAPAPPPEAETMTGGEHFRHPGGGGSRAKPGISPTWASATCPEREHAPKIATPEAVAGRLLPIAKLQAMMLAHTRTTQRYLRRRRRR